MKLEHIVYDRQAGEWVIICDKGGSYIELKAQDLEAVFDTLKTLKPDCSVYNNIVNNIISARASRLYSSKNNFLCYDYELNIIYFLGEIHI